MFVTRDCKYNICSGRRNGLMSGGSINNYDVNNALCRDKHACESDSTHWKNQSILLFDVSLDPCNVSVFLTPQSYHSEVWDNHSLWSVLNNRNKLISASLEKVATCSLSNVGCSFFTQTFFDSWIALYVDENYPLPKNKYDISSSRVRSKHGDGRFNNQTDLKIKFGINASFFV